MLSSFWKRVWCQALPCPTKPRYLVGSNQDRVRGREYPTLAATPGGHCLGFSSPVASCTDACKLQGLESGRAIPRESPGHLQTVSTANIGNSGETGPSLTSSGGLALLTSKSSHFSRSLCQAAAPIFELTSPGFNPLSL